MTFTLPFKTRILWIIRILAASSVIIAVSRYFPYTSAWFNYIAVAITALALVSVIFVFFYLKSYKITSNGGSLAVAKGIFIKNTDIMPFARLVFGAGFRTPLARLMGLEGLVLRAARGFIIVPELNVADSQYILGIIGGEKDE